MSQSARTSIESAFDRARAKLGIRTEFPAAGLREAEQIASERDPARSAAHADRTALPFVTVDPPGSRDLDQAVHAERQGDGYRLRYAIADVGFWVDRGSAVEAEAWRRGVTMYAPDEKQPLYPPALSEGAASLLPDRVTPAVLFSFELDQRAALVSSKIERARIRSRAQLTYRDLLGHVEEGSTRRTDSLPWSETLALVAEIGRKRRALEAERGGVSLPIREQHVERRAAERLGYVLIYEEPNAAEQWNVQISLLTGHSAALRMLDAGVGLLRTLAPADPAEIEKLRLAARTLGVRWPEEQSYAEFVRQLDPQNPTTEALVWQARRVMRGAGYLAFSGELPPHPEHAALAFAYAHCTAPLRRLADRYVLDLLLVLAAGEQPPAEHVATLFKLPPVMEAGDRRDGRLLRCVVDLAEAYTLRDRVGEQFAATVLGSSERGVEVQIEQPPVRTRIDAGDQPAPPLGEDVTVRLTDVDVETARVTFLLDSEAPTDTGSPSPQP